MKLYTNVDVIVDCAECEKKFNLIEDSIVSICIECSEKNYSREVLETFTSLISHFDNHIDLLDDSIIGFNTPEEKSTYIKNYRQGYTDAIFWFADFLGESYVHIFEKWQEKWLKMPINSELDKHDKNRCDKCNGNGYLE